MDRLDTEARAYVEQLGHDATSTNIAQMRVLLRAFEKFVERNELHDDLWQGDTAGEQSLQLRHKALRIYNILGSERKYTVAPEKIVDEGIDAINYAVFTIRKLEERSDD